MPREIVSLDFDWRFHRGEIPAGPISPAYDDSKWQEVDVPHDYVVEGTFDSQADTLHGSLPVEPGWYRKTIDIPAAGRGRRSCERDRRQPDRREEIHPGHDFLLTGNE